MADRFYKLSKDGQLMQITDDTVIDQIKADNQRQILERLQVDTLTNQDLIDMIMSQYTVTKPDGEIVPVDEIVDQPINLPMKLGYKWELILRGDSIVYQLVKDRNAIGTSDENPIIYYQGVPLIDNAFYKKDGHIQVYVAGEWVIWNVD